MRVEVTMCSACVVLDGSSQSPACKDAWRKMGENRRERNKIHTSRTCDLFISSGTCNDDKGQLEEM